MGCNCNTTLGNVKFHRENCTQLLAQQFGSYRELHRRAAEIAALVELVKEGRDLVHWAVYQTEDFQERRRAFLKATEKYANATTHNESAGNSAPL